MGAHINSLSLSKSEAMEAVLKEVREKRLANRESGKRKRDVHSSEACPNAQKRSANVAWAYSVSEYAHGTLADRLAAEFEKRLRREGQPRGSGVRHLVRRKCVQKCRAFVPGTSRNFASEIHA